MAGNFHVVECPDCGNEQTVFGRASTVVTCVVCGSTLATPGGGRAQFTGDVVETVEVRE